MHLAFTDFFQITESSSRFFLGIGSFLLFYFLVDYYNKIFFQNDRRRKSLSRLVNTILLIILSLLSTISVKDSPFVYFLEPLGAGNTILPVILAFLLFYEWDRTSSDQKFITGAFVLAFFNLLEPFIFILFTVPASLFILFRLLVLKNRQDLHKLLFLFLPQFFIFSIVSFYDRFLVFSESASHYTILPGHIILYRDWINPAKTIAYIWEGSPFLFPMFVAWLFFIALQLSSILKPLILIVYRTKKADRSYGYSFAEIISLELHTGSKIFPIFTLIFGFVFLLLLLVITPVQLLDLQSIHSIEAVMVGYLLFFFPYQVMHPLRVRHVSLLAITLILLPLSIFTLFENFSVEAFLIILKGHL